MERKPKISIRETTSAAPSRSVTVAAFGDLMLAGEWDALAAAGEMEAALAALEPICQADLVLANLEATAPGDGERIVKQPRLIGQRATLESALRILGVDVVSLANNHTFDACLGGFLEVRAMLEELGVAYQGAGEHLTAAAEPLFLERGGLRFGLLAYTDLETRPSHIAGEADFGVNPLDAEEALREVTSLREDVDHVIVSLHWGVEYCHLPAPAHIRLARQLVDAGARLVIGHHAHVVQGAEVWSNGVIAYNLGNAATTDLEIDGRLAIRQSTKTRSTYALRATFMADRIEGVELIPFFTGRFSARRGGARLGDRRARQILERAQQGLAAGVSEQRWKRVRLYEDVVLRTLKKLHPRVIGSVRPRHFVKFFKNLAGAASGRGPAA